MRFSLLLAISFSFLLSACGTNPKDDPYAGMPEEKIFRRAEKNLRHGNYEKASDDFEGLESHFPFGKYAERAQLGTIYAYYRGEEPQGALAAADRFIRMNPSHSDVDYAYYMKGMVHYEAAFPFPIRNLPMDTAKRDNSEAEQAYIAFEELLRIRPQSRYAQDARQRLIHLRNLMSEHEFLVADFYFRKGAYLAAANRASYAVKHFSETPAARDAVKLMAKSYRRLKMDDLAVTAEKLSAAND